MALYFIAILTVTTYWTHNILPATSSLTLSTSTCHILPYAAVIRTYVSTAGHAGNISNHGWWCKYKKVYKCLYKSQDASVTKKFLCYILQKSCGFTEHLKKKTVAVGFKLALQVYTNCNRRKNGVLHATSIHLTTVKPSFGKCVCHHIRILCI